MKIRCQCCGIEREFADSEEAFRAGWDAPPYFSQVVTCDLCPASGLVVGISHNKAHVYWEKNGRPIKFNHHCVLDSDWKENPPKYKAGDSFWLIPTSINPLAVKVTIDRIVGNGYVVDEPVGIINNDECVFDTREAAEKKIIDINKPGGCAEIRPEFDTATLSGLRKFLIDKYKSIGMVLPNCVEKKRGEEWFTIQDLTEKN
jgi:hypothetical protein